MDTCNGLGRAVSVEDRAHLTRCKKCRKKLARLENAVLQEGLEMHGQASLIGGAPRPESGESGAAAAGYDW